ncbi:MAG: cytochrome c-type biogenesis protein CcmH [Acidobacteria bacterium]|nr:cytochrome c-type biogenesis protein CcmH [Acidobacteriota bacterium]
MSRFKRLFPLVLVAWALGAQNASMMINPDVRRVGSKLACLCGSCKNTVGDCQMIGCGYSSPARTEIVKLASMGASDENVIAKFVQREGIKALAVPPSSGFNLSIWIMPIVMLMLGLYAIYVYIQRYRRPAPAPIAVAHRFHEIAAKDLDGLE